MADVMPNYTVEIQRLKSRIADQHQIIERQKLEILEMEDRRSRHEENIEAAKEAIKKMELDLKGLIETHGKEAVNG